ncbi:MAG: hypothetical protein S4CHLAM7_12680 [Chlamydiae bacterium]|nr:hypothetical protein [Chlamydiota bacterium]
MTTIQAQASQGNLNGVESLIAHNTDINHKNEMGRTALHEAAKINDINLIKYLVDNNADIFAKDNEHCTPLRESAVNCLDAKTTRLFLEHLTKQETLRLQDPTNKCDVDKSDYNTVFEDALKKASENNNLDMVKLSLLEAKHGWRRYSLFGSDECFEAFNNATENNCQDIVEFLVCGNPRFLCEFNYNFGNSIIHKLVIDNKLESLRSLLNLNINIKNKDFKTYSGFADYSNESVEKFTPWLKNSIKFALRYHDDQSFVNMNLAAESLAKFFFGDKTMLIDLPNEKTETALHLACKNNNVEAAKLLVDNKADLEARENYGRTPLLLATIMKSEKVTHYLLNKTNCNKDAKDFLKQSASDLAEINNDQIIIDLLKNPNQPLPIRPPATETKELEKESGRRTRHGIHKKTPTTLTRTKYKSTTKAVKEESLTRTGTNTEKTPTKLTRTRLNPTIKELEKKSTSGKELASNTKPMARKITSISTTNVKTAQKTNIHRNRFILTALAVTGVAATLYYAYEECSDHPWSLETAPVQSGWQAWWNGEDEETKTTFQECMTQQISSLFKSRV